MLLYKNLTRLQKRYVKEAMKYKDLIKDYPLITVAEQRHIQTLIRADHKKRKTGIKIGYPWYWMNRDNNRYAKGVYHLPVPSEHDIITELPLEEMEKALQEKYNYNNFSTRSNGITQTGNTIDPEEGDFGVLQDKYSKHENVQDFCQEAGIYIPSGRGDYY